MSRRSEEQDLARSRGRPEGLPKRWSAQRKAEVVLRLLRGEGLADYGGNIGAYGSGSTGWESGSPRYDPPAGRDAAEIEGNVAALFHDLIDSNNEGDDETHYDAYDVITAFRTCRASGSQGDETSDFVWCLEGEVDDDVHDDHFPRAGAPSSVSATRPSSWDEDDIRWTWIQNVSEGN